MNEIIKTQVRMQEYLDGFFDQMRRNVEMEVSGQFRRMVREQGEGNVLLDEGALQDWIVAAAKKELSRP